VPVLQDPKHEAFAQALARGQTADKAYVEAGYKPNRGNASTLKAKQSIQARVTEVQEAKARKVVEHSAFEAKTMFEALLQDIDDAKEAKDFKTAADLRKFMISCFGYEDSPTLTHEHVKGTKIPVHDKPEGDEPEEPRVDMGNVTKLADAINKLRKRAG
jgi:hypothetical protein